jgi:cysteine sulfinate desulfinase/cysteine desulfurase-like protein
MSLWTMPLGVRRVQRVCHLDRNRQQLLLDFGLAATVPNIVPGLVRCWVSPEIGMGAVRFSLGRATTREEIEEVVSRL